MESTGGEDKPIERQSQEIVTVEPADLNDLVTLQYQRYHQFQSETRGLLAIVLTIVAVGVTYYYSARPTIPNTASEEEMRASFETVPFGQISGLLTYIIDSLILIAFATLLVVAFFKSVGWISEILFSHKLSTGAENAILTLKPSQEDNSKGHQYSRAQVLAYHENERVLRIMRGKFWGVTARLVVCIILIAALFELYKSLLSADLDQIMLYQLGAVISSLFGGVISYTYGNLEDEGHHSPGRDFSLDPFQEAYDAGRVEVHLIKFCWWASLFVVGTWALSIFYQSVT